MSLGESIAGSGGVGAALTGSAMVVYSEMWGPLWPLLAGQIANMSDPGAVSEAGEQHNALATRCTALCAKLQQSQKDHLPAELWQGKGQSAATANAFDP